MGFWIASGKRMARLADERHKPWTASNGDHQDRGTTAPAAKAATAKATKTKGVGPALLGQARMTSGHGVRKTVAP